MFKCKYCNQEFENKYKLSGHATHCKLNLNYERNKINCNNVISKRGKSLITSECPYCKENITSTKSGVTFHIDKTFPTKMLHRSILKYYPEFFKNKIYIRSYNK